jgi:hypothetical protein
VTPLLHELQSKHCRSRIDELNEFFFFILSGMINLFTLLEKLEFWASMDKNVVAIKFKAFGLSESKREVLGKQGKAGIYINHVVHFRTTQYTT